MIELNITIEDVSPPIPGKTIKIARFEGQLDSSNVEEKQKMFNEIITRNPKNLFFIFDFEKLTYMNSRAIGCLAECHATLEKGGGRIVIADPAENIMDILKVVGIEKFVLVYPTVDAAKAALMQ
jgi:anti-anti-sigma factor